MKYLISIGAGAVLLASAAWAQDAATQPPTPPGLQTDAKVPPGPPPAAPRPGDPARRPPAPPPGEVADDGPGGSPPGGPHGHRPPPPPPPRGAHFRLERGDLALDVGCADSEPMKACADLTMQLLDKLQAMPKD